MLEQNVIHSNGHLNGVATPTYPECPSDYEAVPHADAPKPGWRNQFPQYTHNVSWQDSDSKQHSLTIRTDDIHELFGVLKGLKNTIRASKAKAAESQPQADAPAQPDTQHCHIHGVDMPRRWSKRTNGHYFAHKLPDGGFCYGRARS